LLLYQLHFSGIPCAQWYWLDGNAKAFHGQDSMQHQWNCGRGHRPIWQPML